MNNPPAFQFYPADFLADENVALMTNQEIGCYVKLMCYCWREGSIPSEVPRIAKLCGEDSSAMAQLWLAIAPCFSSANKPDETASRLVHPRLEKERQKQIDFHSERSKAGLKGSLSRWGKDKKEDSSAIAQPLAQPMAKNGSSSSISSSINTPLPPQRGEVKSAKAKKRKVQLSPEEEAERDKFISDFGAAYTEHHKGPYLGAESDPGRATKLIKRAKAKGLPTSGIIEMAKLAWSVADDPNVQDRNKFCCKKVHTLGYVNAHYNEIKAEVMAAKKNETKRPNENHNRTNRQFVNGSSGTLNEGRASDYDAYLSSQGAGVDPAVPNAGQS
jgi:hypothetical protein